MSHSTSLFGCSRLVCLCANGCVCMFAYRLNKLYDCICSLLSCLPLIGSEQLFEEAMKHGYVNSRDTKILICGAAGSGKTCFRHLLLGDPPPKTRTSTPLAVRPVTVHCFDASSNWKEFSIVERKVNLVMAMKNHLRQDSSSVDGENDYPNLQETLEDTSETSSSENAEKVVDSVTIDEELISLLPRCSSSAPITSFQRFHIIDSGGQPEFYELLPIFMKDLSACVFVVKLSDELSSQPTAVWYRRGQKYPFSYKSDKTHEQLFKLCIRTVHSLKITSKKEVSPKILVLGTHKDEEEKCTETREEKNRKLADALFPLYEDDVISPGVGGEVLFGVDAKTPGPEDQRVATDIRQFIAEIPRTPVKIPHQWYALEIMLKDQADILGRGVLTKECFKVASKKLHFNESSLTAALKHLNGLSLVFYREDILPNVVFVNPQVPLDKVTDLVIVRYNMDSYRYPMCADTRAFFDRALVSIDFLKKFKRHYFPGVFTAANLVELFRKLFVLADYDSTKFFIPALLEMSTPEELDKYRVLCDSPVPPLVVEFSSDTPLLGVFCTLVCFLLSKRKCKSDSQWTLNRERTRTPTCLHRNCIQFNIPRCSHGVVTMIDADRRFEFHIAHGLTNDNFQILCPIIHGAVREGLTSVNEVLSYKTSEPTNAILCPCGNGDLHTATVDITRKEWICGNDSLVHDSLSENQTLWLQQDSGMHSLLCCLFVVNSPSFNFIAEWSSLEEESGRLETKKGIYSAYIHIW